MFFRQSLLSDKLIFKSYHYGFVAGDTLSVQWPAVCLFLLSYMGRHVITYIKDNRLDHFARRESSQLRKQLLGKLFELGPRIVQEEILEM